MVSEFLMEQHPIHVTLDSFEGPLDLLWHLIEKHEIDIYQIPIALITDQYIRVLKDRLDAQLEVASEFLVMAASLVALKARALLPRQEAPAEEDEEIDAIASERALTERLLEYRAFKEVARVLKEMEGERALSVGRMPMNLDAYKTERCDPPQLLVSAEQLMAAFEKVLARIPKERDVRVVRERETIPERMRRILRMLRDSPATFSSLLMIDHPREIVTSFLALLELIRNQQVTCRQEGLFSEIWIERITL
ncbi:hypothetical protein ATW55_09035 [Ferroacidibacillus organovorans]|uniref:Segregation and condensation protein A n=2 Tax=Ferroacidibacillus organovorans TaxID=1765683 RepID=A0A117SXT9_9BACL|nr:hypothetical protein ATW55_09035 [Ferroacidibacillus organovorans]